MEVCEEGAPPFAKGSYGTLNEAGDAALVKRTELFDEDDHYLITENLNEAILAAYCAQHEIPHVIKYGGVELRDGTIRITQERARGGDLSAFIRDNPYPARKRAFNKIFTQVIEGMYALHEHGILHGDLNPRNVVILDESLRVAIIDLGSSQLHARHNRHNQACTYPYAPPEVFEDEEVACLLKADAYSLGATIYDYFYKDTLYDSKKYTTREEVRELHRAGTIEYPQACPSGFPPDVFDIMLGLLRKDPSERIGIKELYFRLADPIVIIDVPRARPATDSPPSMIFDMCKQNSAHTELACALVKRYGATVRRLCDCDEIMACVRISCSISENKCCSTTKAERVAITNVLSAVGFDLL